MTLAVWYWLFFVLWFLGGGYAIYTNRTAGIAFYAPNLVATVLFFIIGLRVFGSPVK